MRNLGKVEENNLEQIRRLNQRGGRMLSIVDLIEDDTLDTKSASYLLYCMSRGQSILTAAGPSGTGKTTLMGALLNLIPLGARIKTITDLKHPDSPEKNLVYYLAHEINNAHYYGYIWGSDARQFFELAKEHPIAVSVHADSLEEVKRLLLHKPINLGAEHFLQIDLILFMTMQRGFSKVMRRVSKVYGLFENEHRTLFSWDIDSDSIAEVEAGAYLDRLAKENDKRKRVDEKITEGVKLFQRLKTQGIRRLEDVRRELLNSYPGY